MNKLKENKVEQVTFKIGDKVVRLGGDCLDVKVGSVYEVEEIISPNSISLVGNTGAYYSFHFKLAEEEKVKFKIGDKVRRINLPFEDIKVGDVCVVDDVVGSWITVVGGDGAFLDSRNFELFQEEPEFDMHTQPWFIRIDENQEKFDLVRAWLKENYGISPSFSLAQGVTALTNFEYATQVVTNRVWWCYDIKNVEGVPEIKINTKKVVDSVEYPVVKSPLQLQIEELEATIKKAQEQIQQLKESA